MFTHERGRLFTVKEPTLHALCYLHQLMGLFKMYMYIYFHDLFDYKISKEGEIRSSGEERIACTFDRV